MKKLVSLVLALIMVLSMGMAMAEEPIKIRWAMGCGGTAPVDAAMGQEALNKLLREKINVEVEIQYFTEDQLMNSINTGEVFDIYFTCDWYFNTNQATSDGLFLDVAEAVKTVTPDLYASMSEDVWELAKTPEGGLYAIPNQKDYAAINLITYPVEKAKELGFEMPESISAWSELTPFLEAWKATLPEGEYPVLIGGAARGLESSFDFIDRVALIGCVYGTTDVVTVFEDPEIMDASLSDVKDADLRQIGEYAIKRGLLEGYLLYPMYRYEEADLYSPQLLKRITVDGKDYVVTIYIVRLPFVFEDDVEHTKQMLATSIQTIFQ
jgi:ABC-type glycerol-3-phosphate transport system substrate-binding protein